MNKRIATFAVSALSVAVLSGCSSTNQQVADVDVTQSAEYQQLEQQLEAARSAGSRTAELEAEISRLQSQSRTTTSSSGNGLLPPNPQPGECYARVVIPAQYKNVSETVQVAAPSSRIETTAAKYQWVEQRVVATEASTRLEVVPATYKTVTETIQVSDAGERLERVPATYKTVTKRIMVSPERTEWKKGRGPIERIDSASGEIMCLVTIPAQYRTVTERVVVTPESVRTIAVPGETKTITRRVVDRPATTRTIEIPATYKTVKVRKLVTPASQRTIQIPGKTETVSKRVMVTPSSTEWRSILCETNTTADVIRRLQVALKQAGYNPGAIDGVYGSDTLSAVNRYQRANNMASGQLTMATLAKLGVKP